MKTHSMNRVLDGGHAGGMLRVGSLFVALCAAGCSGNAEDGLAENGKTDSVEQAIDLPPIEPMCPPSCPIPNVLRGGFSCNCLPDLMDSSFETNFARMSGVWAFQSSTDYYGYASRAIDGIIDGNYWNWGVSHTKNVGPVSSNAPGSTTDQQWLEIRLGAPRRVRHVRIYNRTDCCAERLGSFSIWGIDAHHGDWARIGGANMNGNTTRIIDIDVNDLDTWVIIIQKNDTDYLSLAEVQVWGYLEL